MAKTEFGKYITEAATKRLLSLLGDETMGSKVCNDCHLLFAYIAVDYCYIAWVIPKDNPQLTEEQVLGTETRPCKNCVEKLNTLGITNPQEIAKNMEGRY